MNERQERRALLVASLIISGISLVTSAVTITVTQSLATYAPTQRIILPPCTDAIADAGGMCKGPLLPACPTEDSTACYWDADTMGNGRGNDLVSTAP